MFGRHGKKPKSSSILFSEQYVGLGTTLLVASTVLGVETYLVTQFAKGLLSMRWLAAGHSMVIAMLGVHALRCWGAQRDIGAPLLLAVTTLAMGPLGAAGTLAAIGMTAWFRRSALSFQEWYESLFPTQETTDVERVFDEVSKTAGDLDSGELAVPFIDIMTVGSVKQKQAAIALIARNFDPQLSGALLQALNDSSNTVRVQAAATVAAIENRFLEETLELQRHLEEAPESTNLMLQLAVHYDDYAYTGLLDPVRENKNRVAALEMYQSYLSIHPENGHVHTSILRLLVRERRFLEARDWFQQHLRTDEAPAGAILWLMECEYALGNWSAVRGLAAAHRDRLSMKDFPDRVVEALKLWSADLQLEEVESA